jgi:hypothetical protein
MSTAERLVAHFGGKKKTRQAFGVSGETIRLWLRDGLPLHRAIDFEKRSKGAVTAEEILQEAKVAARKTQREARAAA